MGSVVGRKIIWLAVVLSLPDGGTRRKTKKTSYKNAIAVYGGAKKIRPTLGRGRHLTTLVG